MSITILNSLLKKSNISYKEGEEIFSHFKREIKNITELNQYKILLRLLSKIPYGKLRDSVIQYLNIGLCKYPCIKLKYEQIMSTKQKKYTYIPLSSYWFPVKNISENYLHKFRNLNLCTLSHQLKNEISEKNLDFLLFIYFIKGDYQILHRALTRLVEKGQYRFFNILFFIEAQAKIPTVKSSIENFYLSNCSQKSAYEIFKSDFQSTVQFKHFYYSLGFFRHLKKSIFADVKYLRLDLMMNLQSYFQKNYAFIDLIFLYKENYKINFYFVKTDRKFSTCSKFIDEYEIILQENERLLTQGIFHRQRLESKIKRIFSEKNFNFNLCDDVILIIDNDIYFFPFEELGCFKNSHVIRCSSIDCLLMNTDSFKFRKDNLKILYDNSANLKSTTKKFTEYFKRRNIRNEKPNALIYIGHGCPVEEKSYEIEILFGCKSHRPMKVRNFNAYFKRSLKETKIQVGLLGSATDSDLNRFSFSFLGDLLSGVDFYTAKRRAQKKCEYYFLTGALVVIHGNCSYFSSYFN